MTKSCSICKIEKVIEEFSKNAHSKDGILSSCKICENQKQEIVRENNRLKNKTLNLEGNKKCSMCKQHKPKTSFHINRCQDDGLHAYCKSCTRIMKTNYLKEDIRRFLLTSAKCRAKKKNLQFSLTKEDIIVPEKCPVFDIPLYYSKGGKTDNSPTLDRINNKRGYTKDNVVVISFKANRIKSNATVEELEKLVNFYKLPKL